jgi:hypothetical protein
MGYRSLLMVPLLAGARSIGVLEACASAERLWSRTQTTAPASSAT